MLPPNNPDRIRIVFDDHRLVANAGLLLSATLAQHLGLRELVDHHLDLGGAPGRANTGDKMLSWSPPPWLAATASTTPMRCAPVGRSVMVKAPSTLGTFLRSFRWGHVRQLDRVSRQLLARAWAAGAGPGDSPLTIDLDSNHLRDLWTGQGGSAPPRLHRRARVSPAAGHCRRHRRGADVPSARGPGQHRPRRRPLPP